MPSFVSDLFCSPQRLCDKQKLLHVIVVPSFLLPSTWKYTLYMKNCNLSIQQFLGIWVVSSLGLLWIKFYKIFAYMLFTGAYAFIYLGWILKVEFWGNRIDVCLTLGFPVVLVLKNLPANAGHAGDRGAIPGLGRYPGEGNGNHSSILAWRIPWTEEPGRLQSIGSQRAVHDWSDLACMHPWHIRRFSDQNSFLIRTQASAL